MDADGDDSDDEEWERVVAGPSTEVVLSAQPAVGTSVGEWFVERSKFIPLRLNLAERKYLRLLEAALSVSEYTDKIDTIGFGLSKAKRIVQQIRELCAIMSGLLLSADYKRGQELFTDRCVPYILLTTSAQTVLLVTFRPMPTSTVSSSSSGAGIKS
jgi:hypothetical protein